MAENLINVDAEPAWKVVKATQEAVYVWRVNKLKLEVVPLQAHGEFYNGDTYIVLHSYKIKEKIHHDAFLWIGAQSSQDEYSFGAYKLVELDSGVLNDAATQYREVQGSESAKFLGVFQALTIRQGGYDTGFKKVQVNKTPQLFHISGVKKSVRVMEVAFFVENILSDDVFIIDLVDSVYLFIGKTSNKDEKFFAMQSFTNYKQKKPNAKYEIIDEETDGRPNEVFSKIPTGGQQSSVISAMKTRIPTKDQFVLVKVSDETGNVKFNVVSKGNPVLSSLVSDDIFVLNVKTKMFVWVGKNSNAVEKRSALIFAQKFAEIEGIGLCPIDVVKEGNESEEFTSSFC